MRLVRYLKRLTKARSVQAACVPMRAAQKMVLSLLLEISRSSLLHDSNCQLIWTKDRFAGASVADPDSIRSVDPDPDPGGKKLPTKIKNKKLKQSQVLHCWMFSFEG